jgi:flagellar hook protein FlgE
MTFDANGKLTSPTTTTTLTLTSPNPAVGTNGQFTAQLDMTNATQYGTAFAVSNLTQDGYTAGELTGLSIGENGVITSRYSNGQTQSSGQVTLADFRNVQGLSPLGANAWAATFASGEPVQGSPGNGKFGALQSGALEESNVDLTSELVNMMTAQRAYQANAQTIKTQDQVMSTLVNLR